MVITHAIEHDHTKLISHLSPIALNPNIKNLEKFPSAFEGRLIMSMKFLVEEDWAYVYSLREGGKLCLLYV